MAQEEGERASSREATAPEPEDPRKPDSPDDLTKRSWMYVLRKTVREFSSDQGTDLAAALTYYGTLAVFPALLAFVAILGLVGDARETTEALFGLLTGLVPADTLDTLREPIENLVASPSAGFALVIGIGGALWSASGYVGAFGRAMNRIYAIQEGRPFWKLRPLTLAVTVLAIALAVLAALIIVLSGPIAERAGQLLGIGDTVLTIWDFAKWPLLVVLAIIIIAVLYHATPNVKQPKFRWISIGALLALVVWGLASAGFGLYAANFSSYNETYGSIGGIIVFLLWLWISNVALIFGAELDAELERGRQLQAGIVAEENIQLPPRDTKQSDKQAEQHKKDVRLGRELRRHAGRSAEDPSDTDDTAKGEEATGEKARAEKDDRGRREKLL